MRTFICQRPVCERDRVLVDRSHIAAVVARTHAASRINVLMTPRGLEPFPAASMKRFEAYLEREEELKRMDYVWHIDIDSEFIEHVGHELLVDGTFAVAHADNYYYDGSEVAGVKDNGEVLTMRDLGVVRDQPSDRAKFFKQEYVFDLANPRVIVGDPPYDGNHNARIPMDKAKYYFFGAVWGGRITEALEAFRVLRDWIRTVVRFVFTWVSFVHCFVLGRMDICQLCTTKATSTATSPKNPPKRVLTLRIHEPCPLWTHPWLFKTFKQEEQCAAAVGARMRAATRQRVPHCVSARLGSGPASRPPRRIGYGSRWCGTCSSATSDRVRASPGASGPPHRLVLQLVIELP